MESSGSNRQNNFNFLRLVFALLVILSHAPELIDGNRSREILTQIFHTVSFGEFAVDGFFLLSGYLIVQSWNLTPAIGRFLKKRILRIYPGFIVATLVSVFIVGPLAANAYQYFSDLHIGAIAWRMMRLGAPIVPPVFHGQPHPVVNGAMWTIVLEFTCYLSVCALGVIGVTRKRSVWMLLTCLLLAIDLSPRLGYSIPAPTSIFDWNHPIFHMAGFFFAGGCFYLYRDRVTFNRKAAIIAAATLLIGMFSWGGVDLALATVGAYLLFYTAFKHIPLIEKFNNLPDVSYGVYLYGWPVEKLLHWYFPSMSPWVLFPIACITCLFLGTLSWYVIEKPMLKLKSVSWVRKASIA